MSSVFTMAVGRLYNWTLSAPPLYDISFCAADRLARVTIPVTLNAPEVTAGDVTVGGLPCFREFVKAAPAANPKTVNFVCENLPVGEHAVKFSVDRLRERRRAAMDGPRRDGMGGRPVSAWGP